MLPICLVTGFLGTGKTTFLKHVVARNRDRKIVYLINEFSAHDVDGAIVSAENPNVVSIPGGSIFCKCLVTEFIGQLKNVAKEWGEPAHSESSPYLFGQNSEVGRDLWASRTEGVVIEASGMANPKVMEQMLAETGLDKLYRLATVVSVIDPNSFLKLRHTLPNIIAQIEASDVVLINKTDRNPPEKIAETYALVRQINPAAERIQTVRCNAEIDLFAEHAPRGLQGEYAKCRDPNYATFVTEQPFNGTTLAAFVRAHADDIYRVKGTLADEFFDYSTAGIIRTPQPGAGSKLAWIVKGSAGEKITEALNEISPVQ
ncbi:MAG: GTP-binding protein [Kiritimatiellales bacterium]|jgi:G3E family GTPase